MKNLKHKTHNLKIRKGDTVQVQKGKDAGKKGKVLRVIAGAAPRITVAGVSIVKKHLKPKTKRDKPGRIEFEAPIALANVQLVCPSCGKPTRIGYKLEADSKVRACKKCGKVITQEKSKVEAK